MDEVVKQHKGDKYSTERYFCLVFLYLQIPHTLLIEKLVLCVLDKSQHLIADGNWKPTFSFERESGIGGCENLCKILWIMHIPRAQVHQSKNKNIFKEFTMNWKYRPFVQTLLKNYETSTSGSETQHGTFQKPWWQSWPSKKSLTLELNACLLLLFSFFYSPLYRLSYTDKENKLVPASS